MYQEENPGVEFEYSMKKDSVKETPVGQASGGYQWTQVQKEDTQGSKLIIVFKDQLIDTH